MTGELSRCMLISLTLLPLLAAAPSVHAQQQEQQDSTVTLISARSASLIEKKGQNFRRVIGPARFFHNNTYLLCDTALWNVGTNIIDATGHVQIIQDRTVLRSETLQYVVDDNLAKFRGNLVELEDKEHNILRTRYLDYNTKDSVAVFQNGASMKDKDGQIIESRYGTYDSKESLFTFNENVNMFSDTTFVKTSRLEYRSDTDVATFAFGTDVWHDDKMLSSNGGWYDRRRELFLFRRNVHLLTPDQEGWADTLYYYRVTNDMDARGRATLLDTTRNVTALAGKLEFTDSLSQVRLTRHPAILGFSEQDNGGKDTTWVGGDSLYYRAYMMFQLPENFRKDSDKKIADISGDPIREYRRKAAEAAAKAAEEAARKDPNRPPDTGGRKSGPGEAGGGPGGPGGRDRPDGQGMPDGQGNAGGHGGDDAPGKVAGDGIPPVDSTLKQVSDSLAIALPDSLGAVKPPLDSLAIALPDSLGVSLPDSLGAAPPDSLAGAMSPQVPEGLNSPADSLGGAGFPADTLAAVTPLDSTRVNILWGHSNVKVFRRDLQASCDSLNFNDLDSLVRMYKDPLIFNEGNREYSSDSIYVVIKNKVVRKAHLISNAFITTQEDTLLYDQIKGAEMVAYFDSTAAPGASTLTRFDALGGASAVFFLTENDAIATVNKVESKMLYGVFVNGELDRMYYFEGAKNDAYPIVQLPKDDRVLKGFRWDPQRRPNGPEDITTLRPRASERLKYLRRPHATFTNTDEYFPGYISGIYKEIAIRDSLEIVHRREREWLRLHPPVDSTAVSDSLALADTLAVPDSLAITVPADSLSTGGILADSLAIVVPKDSTMTVSPADTLAAPEVDKPLTEKDLKELEKQRKAEQKQRKAEEKARRKAERDAAREAKWAEQDRIYAEKQAAKEQKRLEKERAKKLRALRRLERKAQKEKAVLDRYIQKEREKAAAQQSPKATPPRRKDE